MKQGRDRFEHLLLEPEDENKVIIPPALEVRGYDRFRGGYWVQYDNLFVPSSGMEFLDPVNSERYHNGLLISPLGLDLVRKTIVGSPGKNILKLIEDGLVEIHSSINSEPNPKPSVTLAPGIKLKYHSLGGGQSWIYLLEISEDLTGDKSPTKLIVKVRKTEFGVDQSYINEMLQTQEVQQFFDSNGHDTMGFSRFVFASSSVCCTVFEEGDDLSGKESIDTERFHLPLAILRLYVSGQAGRGGKDNIWNRIMVDDRTIMGEFKLHQFIERPDGKIIFIDPFFRC